MKLTNIKSEGSLISYDLLAEIFTGEAKGQKPQDFGIKGNIINEMSLSWSDALSYWNSFKRSLERLDENARTTQITRERWIIPLLETLGFKRITPAKEEIIDSAVFPISHRCGETNEHPPLYIHSSPKSENELNNLDKRTSDYEIRLSPHSLVQEYLNRTEHLWGIVTNGFVLRILRNSSRLSRPTYIEFDLRNIMESENFNEYQLFFRLVHYSRWYHSLKDASQCILEDYYQHSIELGGRVRDKLRDNVEKAIVMFANGLLKHPNNHNLRDNIKNGKVSELDFYRQLLKLIYRFLFLMVSEERNLVGPALSTETDEEQKRRKQDLRTIYISGYSITRLRSFVEKYFDEQDTNFDIWEQVKTTFRIYSQKEYADMFDMNHLNSDLFGSISLDDFEDTTLSNKCFVEAFRQMSLFYDEQDRHLKRINYAHIDVEELGSVYESLLDYHPSIKENQGVMYFQFIAGTERKSTGSYYTRSELVGELIKSTLEPIIEERLSNAKSHNDKINALLNIRICDPASGSGHFLLASARRIAQELAKVVVGDETPTPSDFRKAVRDVIKHCIYGVDLNPLAVDLCKVALWIEGHNRGEQLTFLDHRIKCGNSLIGVDKMSRIDDLIPDEAFNPVTGDDKAFSSKIKALNKSEKKSISQGQTFLEDFAIQTSEIANKMKEIDLLRNEQEKENKYNELKHSEWYSYNKLLCDIWTSAFFVKLNSGMNVDTIPTSKVLWDYKHKKAINPQLKAMCEKLNLKYNFFHWELEFPEVFERNGFDVVIGNPAWEKIKLEEIEFFSTRDVNVANAINSNERKKLIKELPNTNPQLYQEYMDTKHFAEDYSLFVRNSNRFPLTARGDINTYPLFAELYRNIVRNNGRTGVVVPTGIATDSYNQYFFGDLCDKKAIVSLFDFENSKGLFQHIHRSFRFCLLTTSKKEIDNAKFAFFLTNTTQLDDTLRKFTLSPEDISLINPNTKTLPIFRTTIDAELTRKIYRKIPVLINETTNENPWGISFATMFHMANDSGLFRTEPADGLLPLYEAKMIWHYDHRYGSYEGVTNMDNTQLPKTEEHQYSNPNYTITPRYWVDSTEVSHRLASKWNRKWLLAFRSITNATNERTFISSIIPIAGLGNSSPAMLFNEKFDSVLFSCLIANLSSIVFDYIIRQKIAGTNLNFFIIEQLPVFPPSFYTDADISFIMSRVIELVYTSYDMRPFAEEMGYVGEPFLWNEERRHILKSELDAYYAKLYGFTRNELHYILDPQDIHNSNFTGETFRVLKDKETKRYGEYKTKQLILEAWDKVNPH